MFAPHSWRHTAPCAHPPSRRRFVDYAGTVCDDCGAVVDANDSAPKWQRVWGCAHPKDKWLHYDHEGTTVCTACGVVLEESAINDGAWSDNVSYGGTATVTPFVGGMLPSTGLVDDARRPREAWRGRFEKELRGELREIASSAPSSHVRQKRRERAEDAHAARVRAEEDVRKKTRGVTWNRVAASVEQKMDPLLARRKRAFAIIDALVAARIEWVNNDALVNKAKTLAVECVDRNENDEGVGRKFQCATIAVAAFVAAVRRVCPSVGHASLVDSARVVLHGVIDRGRTRYKKAGGAAGGASSADASARRRFDEGRRARHAEKRELKRDVQRERLMGHAVDDDAVAARMHALLTADVVARREIGVRQKTTADVAKSVDAALKAVIPCMSAMGLYAPTTETRLIEANGSVFDVAGDDAYAALPSSRKRMRWVRVAIELYNLMEARKVWNGSNHTPFVAAATLIALVLKRRAIAVESANRWGGVDQKTYEDRRDDVTVVSYDPARPDALRLFPELLQHVLRAIPGLKMERLKGALTTTLEAWAAVLVPCRDDGKGWVVGDEFAAAQIDSVDAASLLEQIAQWKKQKKAPKSS